MTTGKLSNPRFITIPAPTFKLSYLNHLRMLRNFYYHNQRPLLESISNTIYSTVLQQPVKKGSMVIAISIRTVHGLENDENQLKYLVFSAVFKIPIVTLNMIY